MGAALFRHVLEYFALPGKPALKWTIKGHEVGLPGTARPVPVTWLHATDGKSVSYSPRAIAVVRYAPAGRRVPPPGRTPVVLYSHGNAENLASIHTWCSYLATTLGIPVYAYDYCGYGTNTERATAAKVNGNIDSVLRYLIARGHDNVVLYGRSIGTGPTVSAATKHPDVVRAVILQSAFRSVAHCARLLAGLPSWLDLFPNETLLKTTVRQPVFLVHGMQDKVVQFKQALVLAQANCVVGHLWLEFAGHNDIDVSSANQEKVTRAVSHFLVGCGVLGVYGSRACRAHERVRVLGGAS
jgi:pimeloyl-ACP methyl ester carboxylesterase